MRIRALSQPPTTFEVIDSDLHSGKQYGNESTNKVRGPVVCELRGSGSANDADDREIRIAPN